MNLSSPARRPTSARSTAATSRCPLRSRPAAGAPPGAYPVSGGGAYPVASAAYPPPPAAGGYGGPGSQVVTVGPGESLDSLAIRYGVPSVEIAKANGISNPGDLTQGRVIVIPARGSYPSTASSVDAGIPTTTGND